MKLHILGNYDTLIIPVILYNSTKILVCSHEDFKHGLKNCSCWIPSCVNSTLYFSWPHQDKTESSIVLFLWEILKFESEYTSHLNCLFRTMCLNFWFQTVQWYWHIYILLLDYSTKTIFTKILIECFTVLTYLSYCNQ